MARWDREADFALSVAFAEWVTAPLTVKGASWAMGCSENVLRDAIDRGELPTLPSQRGRHWLLRQRDLGAWAWQHGGYLAANWGDWGREQAVQV